MVKLIIHTSDIHIRNASRFEEYAEQLTKFVNKCQELASPYEKDEVRIVICGDLVHQKNTITNELITFSSVFIRQLENIAKVIVISGNHDLVLSNTSKKDTLTAIFETAAFENAFFLDYELEYNSGYIVDDNITWALYSIYNDFKKPNIEDAKEKYPDNNIIGLYHGMILGAKLDNGDIVDNEGTDGDVFNGCDFVIAGDIHKRQVLKRGDVDIVYSGSLIQQTFGETVTQHGFVVWDLEKKTHEFIDLESNYGLYNFEIKKIEDIDNDEEILINYQ
jgi:DNA repair exonuclease SbcCD nuclease subunit